MRTSIAFLAAITCLAAYARPILTVTCSEPNGPRIDFHGGKYEDKQDGFSGVRPTFIFNDDKPQHATVIFGPTASAKDMGYKDTGAFDAVVLVRNSDQITLIASTGTHIAQMYTLYPKKGIGYFTLHKHLPFQDGVASTATLLSKCEFLPK